MQIISAYAPPTFTKPVFVWVSCQCDDTCVEVNGDMAEGAHMIGCFIDALNVDHAMETAGYAVSEAHGSGHWFEIGRFPSWYAAIEVHLAMVKDMQNGRGQEAWEAGYDPYLKFYSQFKDAPAYDTVEDRDRLKAAASQKTGKATRDEG